MLFSLNHHIRNTDHCLLTQPTTEANNAQLSFNWPFLLTTAS